MRYLLILLLSNMCYSQIIYDRDCDFTSAKNQSLISEIASMRTWGDDVESLVLHYQLVLIWTYKIGYSGGIKIEYANLPGNVAAIAKSPGDDEVNIVVDAVKWRRLDPNTRTWLIAHEFGHEVLNLKHGEGGELMFPILPKEEPCLKKLYDAIHASAVYVKNKI